MFSKSGTTYDPCVLIVPEALPDVIAPNVEIEAMIYCLVDVFDMPIISFKDKLFMDVS